MVLKLVSSKTVLAKIFADLDLKEDGNRVTDMMEWIGEAVEHIGAMKQLIHKVSGVDGEPIIKICKHSAALPCDLYRLNQVAFSFNENGPWYPMRAATGSFDKWSDNECKTNCCVDLLSVEDRVLVETVKQLYVSQPNVPVYGNINNLGYKEALELINSDIKLRGLVTMLLTDKGYITQYNVGDTNMSQDLQYVIKPGYINTNVRDGFLKLSYHAIPADKEGYPLIPDMPSYMEAIYWYVTMKLKYPDYLNGKMNREIYYDIRRSWNFYAKQAYAESMMPNYDELESFKNNWLKIVPEVREHENFYSTAGERQHIYKNR